MTDTNKERAEFEAWMPTIEGYPFARQFANLMWKSWQARAAKAPAAEPVADPMNYKGMFLDAVKALAEIDALLGIPEDGCNDPQVTVSALADFIAGAKETAAYRDQWVDAQYTAPPAPTEQWRDIETAPKDGSEILLGRAASEDLDCDAISVPGSWQEGYEDGVDYMGIDDGFVDSHYQIFSGGRSFGAESHRYAPNQPTHWMPIPAPPQGAANKDES